MNNLYGTTFEEASEFSRAKNKGSSQSLVEFAEKTFGPDDGKKKPPIKTHDALRSEPSELVDLVLTNPPFGKRSSKRIGGRSPQAVLKSAAPT